MLERSDLLGNFNPAGHHSISLWMSPMLVAETVSPLLDGGLEFECKRNLFSLHNAKRLYGAKELRRRRAGQRPLVQLAVLIGLATHTGYVSAETFPQHREDGQETVRYAYVKQEMPGFVLGDTDTPVRIKKTGTVAAIKHQDPQVTDRMLANSVELRCPARKGAEGQYRAKQGGDTPLGVCNEHGPAPKGKMCSELGGNVERSAEMTGPCVGIPMSHSIPTKVTDCNTNYIHFVTDPSMLFDWSEPLSYPNQLAYTRLCASRLFLRCTSRMFHAVLDGFSA